MAIIRVGDRRTLIAADDDHKKTVTHIGGDTVYYGTSSVTTESYEDSLDDGDRLTLDQARFFVSGGRGSLAETGVAREEYDRLQDRNLPINVKDYGAVGDGVTDDTVAIQVAIDAVEATANATDKSGGGTVLIPRGVYRVSNLTVSEAVQIVGEGISATRLKAISGTTGSLLKFSPDNTVHLWQNRLVHAGLFHIGLDGNGRASALSGLELNLIERFTLFNVNIRHFARRGLYCSRGVRESWFYRLDIVHCGSIDNGAAALDIWDAQTQQSDNLHFIGLRVLTSWGHSVKIERDQTGGTDAIRSIYFNDIMLHNNATFSVVASVDGYTYTDNHEPHSGNCLLIRDARRIFLSNANLQTPGRGFPAIKLEQGQAGASSNNNVHAVNTVLGSADELNATFTADAGTDVLTFSADHYLVTGAQLRVSSTGTLPAGLSTGTDYWAIKTSATGIKLAISRANAVAGTAIDLTDAGTGTHTARTRDIRIETEYGLARVSNHRTDVAKDGLSIWSNRTGTASDLQEVSYSNL